MKRGRIAVSSSPPKTSALLNFGPFPPLLRSATQAALACERALSVVHRKKFNRHLEIVKQWRSGERKNVLPRMWMIGERKDEGEGG